MKTTATENRNMLIESLEGIKMFGLLFSYAFFVIFVLELESQFNLVSNIVNTLF